jgi:hypothetical protein
MRYNVRCFVAAGLISLATRYSAGAQASTQASTQAPAASDPYVRYTSAARCVEGASRMTAFYWRDKHQDTARYAPATDVIPTPVRDSLRMCASHFSAATVADDDVLPMLQLSLLTGDTTAVNAAEARLTRSLAALPLPRRAWLLEGMASALLGARPAQVTRARGYVRALDALGKPAASERMSTHKIVAEYAWSVGELAVADSEIHASLAAAGELGKAEQLNQADGIAGAFILRATIASVRQGRTAATSILDTAATVALPLTQSGSPYDAYRRQRMESGFAYYRTMYNIDGTTAKTVRADWWMGSPGDTVFPKTNKVTVAIIVHPGNLSFPAIATIRRLHDEFASRGLDFVLMTYTTGYFRTAVTPKPSVEVQEFQRWFVDYLHVPLTMAVEESQFGRLPDGRRQNTRMTNEVNYSVGANALLIGKDGVIRMALSLTPNLENEQVYRRQIAAALGE